jgi:apolipoprotein D and lipocalin family protein
MRLLILTAALFIAACTPNPVYREGTDPLPVAQIDQSRYLGTWYEQARLPNSFEEGCQRATAEYGLRDDGLISVVNTCIDARGEQRVARGRARPMAKRVRASEVSSSVRSGRSIGCSTAARV